ncbi:MAG: hypothetical protein ACOY7J_17365 [Pseudomonadota bacterium]
MHSLKHATLVLATLALCACGGGGGGKSHVDRGGTKLPADGTPSMQEFGDVVARLIRQQDDTAEPEAINPNLWSYHVNENEAAFDHLF